jgi:hypothetical protein
MQHQYCHYMDALNLQKKEDCFSTAFIPVTRCLYQYMNNDPDARRHIALIIDNQIMYFQYLAGKRSS